MTAFVSMLRKEAREHRLVLVVLGALTIASCLVPFLVDVPGVRSAGLPSLVAAFGVLAVALTIAPSLIPSEVGEGARFLGRLPIRPATVFAAKLAFLVAAAAAIGGLGWCATWLTRTARSVTDPAPVRWSDIALVASPLVVGLWLLAITCIVPRALAAIPAAAVVFLVIGAPIWWALREPVQPSRPAVLALTMLAVLAPLAAGWLGFRSMLAGATGSARTALLVGCALSSFVLPAWGWSAWERWRYEHLEPTDSIARIDEVYLAVDGSRAYLNVRNILRKDWMPYSFAVDLETANVIGRGGPQSRYLTLASLERAACRMLATHQALVLFRETSGVELVDCATGRTRVVPGLPIRPSAQFPDLLEADLRAACNGQAFEVAYECEIPLKSRATGALSGFQRVCRPLGGCAVRDSAGREILYLQREGRAHLGLFDPASDTISLATGDWSQFADVDGDLVPLRWESPDTVTVLAHHRRIERLRFGSNSCEVLFPRE